MGGTLDFRAWKRQVGLLGTTGSAGEQALHALETPFGMGRNLKQGINPNYNAQNSRGKRNPTMVPSISRRKEEENIFWEGEKRQKISCPTHTEDKEDPTHRVWRSGDEEQPWMALQNSKASFILFPTLSGMGAALCARASHALPNRVLLGWIVSLIVLIVLLSDAINSLLIPSHVPSAAPLGFDPICSTFQPPGSDLGAGAVPGPRWN